MIAAALLALATLNTADICPAQIHTTQQATDASRGWTAIHSPAKHMLSGLVVYYDHPDTLRELPPHSSRRTRDGDRLEYVFPKETRQVWIDCAYSFTAVVMRRHLPKVEKCLVNGTRGFNGIESITCR